MTVCIAAICNYATGRPLIVTASDRMITIGDIQYDPAQTKTLLFGKKCVALFAGEMQVHAAVAHRSS